MKVMDVEKRKITNILKTRMMEIKKYKTIEMAQEERLKNMFEHLRQLDVEIGEFTDDRELLQATAQILMPEKQIAEQQKTRDKTHHDMRLLEFDLQTMQQKIQRDLSQVQEESHSQEALQIEPKYLAD